MVPLAFHDCFVAIAGAGAALVGLLFVAISVAPRRIIGEQAETAHQVRASIALNSLLGPLIVSLIALIPGEGVSWAGLVSGALGLVTVAGAAARLNRAHRDGAPASHVWPLLVGLTALDLVLAWSGLRLILHGGDTGALQDLCGCLIASLAVGVNRAWVLVGAPDRGVTASIRLLLGRPTSSDD